MVDPKRENAVLDFCARLGYKFEPWQKELLVNLMRFNEPVSDNSSWLQKAAIDAQRRQSVTPPWARAKLTGDRPVTRAEESAARARLRLVTD